MVRMTFGGNSVEICYNDPNYKADYALDVEPPFHNMSLAFPPEKRIYVTTEPSLFDCYTSRYEPQLISDYYQALILSWHPGLSNLPQTMVFQPAAKWVGPMNDIKEFGVSGFVSAKHNQFFNGYQLRHDILHRENEINIPSLIYNHRGQWRGVAHEYPLPSKEPAFKYMFHLAIENCRENNYFTEKLIDTLACRSVPLYFGDPKIADVFNPDGMIFLSDTDYIDQINSLSADEYTKRKEAIEDNFSRSRKYWGFDHHMMDTILKGLTR